MLSDDFLKILRCLHTHSSLRSASDEERARINQAVQSGELQNQVGIKITRPLDGALINAEGTFAYAIYDAIPQMLADGAIPMEQLAR